MLGAPAFSSEGGHSWTDSIPKWMMHFENPDMSKQEISLVYVNLSANEKKDYETKGYILLLAINQLEFSFPLQSSEENDEMLRAMSLEQQKMEASKSCRS